jgi:hypothetical protein
MEITNCLRVSLFSSVLFLIACSSGGGSDDPIENESGGIWRGTVAVADDSSYEAIGFISEAGELRFLRNDGEQTVGTIQTNGSVGNKAFSGSIKSYAPIGEVYALNGQASISLSVSGFIAPKSSFSGDVTYNGIASSTVSFNYDDIYERDSSLAAISGIYSLSDGQGITETYTITSDGSITGSDTTGCVSNGAIQVLDPDFNMYRISLVVSNCGIVNGSYSGLAALLDDGGSVSDTLGFSLTGPNLVISGVIPRT